MVGHAFVFGGGQLGDACAPADHVLQGRPGREKRGNGCFLLIGGIYGKIWEIFQKKRHILCI